MFDFGLETGWVIFNKQEKGFYRVNYDTENWNLLINALKSENYQIISNMNRAQLIDDALSLARAGNLSYSIVFSLLDYLTNETDYIPLTAFVKNVGFLNNLLAETRNYGLFKVCNLIFNTT